MEEHKTEEMALEEHENERVDEEQQQDTEEEAIMKPSDDLRVYPTVARAQKLSEHTSFVTKTYTISCCRRVSPKLPKRSALYF